jgi:mycothiol synthase
MNAATLPPGYRAQTLTPEFEAATVDTINAAYRQMNGGDLVGLQEIQADWHGGQIPVETCTQIVLAPGGSVAGYIDVWDLNALHVRKHSLGYVHPDHTGRGIGTYLLRWSIEHAMRDVNQAPHGARVVLQQGINTTNQIAHDLLVTNGFSPVRYTYRMRIDLNQPVSPVVPEGVTIRPVAPGEEREALCVAFDSFQDHWGAVQEPFEEYFKRHMYLIEHDQTFDPSLWLAARVGDRLVGISMCYPNIEEDPEMGWVGTLGVLRSWRKKGLGLALLQTSFAVFQEHGKPRAGLGVDAESLTGALSLYEKAGMQVWRRNCTYEYELRLGEDLTRKG